MKPSHRFLIGRLCLPVFGFLAVTGAVQAQADGPAGAKAPTAPAPVALSEIDRMNQSLSDLELLRPLLPLNLTQKQIDSIVTEMKAIATEWREVKKQDDAALKALGPDIEKAHAAALTGTPIPKEFDAKVVEAQKAAAVRYNDARLKAMKRLLLALNDSLTAGQKASVEAWSVQVFGGRRIPKQYQSNPSKAPKEEVQALAIAALIERTLLLDRTLTLLQQFKPASAAAAASADSPKEAAAPPTAAKP